MNQLVNIWSLSDGFSRDLRKKVCPAWLRGRLWAAALRKKYYFEFSSVPRSKKERESWAPSWVILTQSQRCSIGLRLSSQTPPGEYNCLPAEVRYTLPVDVKSNLRPIFWNLFSHLKRPIRHIVMLPPTYVFRYLNPAALRLCSLACILL